MPTNNFTPNMPAAGNSLGFTRPLVNANFANYRENLQVNHGDVNGSNFGKHLFLTLPKQTVVPTTLANEGAMSVREYPNLTGQMFPFFRRESDGIESGHIFLSGTTICPALSTVVNLFDFATYPNVYGFFDARINTQVSKVRCLAVIYSIAGTLSIYYFTNLVGVTFSNSGDAGAGIGVTGTNVTAQISSNGPGPAVIFPATISWSFSGYIFAT